MCVLPGAVAIKIQFNVCYLVLFVCLLAKQANIQTTPGNTRSKQTYKQHQVTHIELNELNEHTNNTR